MWNEPSAASEPGGYTTYADGGAPRKKGDIPTGPCLSQGGWENCEGVDEGDAWLEMFMGPGGRIKSGVRFIGGRFGSWLGRKKSVWSLVPVERGLRIETILGGNLPRSFPVIDRFAGGVATSIKSVDLSAATYQTTSRLSSRLNTYVDSIANFRGTNFAGVQIAASDITARSLVIAVPAGAGTAAQQRALRAVEAYGAKQGVYVRVVALK